MRIKIKKFLFIGVFVFTFFGFAHAANAATYYVATTGSDSNPGTFQQPFRTVKYGVSVLYTGDTLYIRGGNYISESISTISGTLRSGTSWSNPITVSAYQNESVIVGRIELHGYDQPMPLYLIFNKLVVDASNYDDGLYVAHGASHVIFQNGEINN